MTTWIYAALFALSVIGYFFVPYDRKAKYVVSIAMTGVFLYLVRDLMMY